MKKFLEKAATVYCVVETFAIVFYYSSVPHLRGSLLHAAAPRAPVALPASGLRCRPACGRPRGGGSREPETAGCARACR